MLLRVVRGHWTSHPGRTLHDGGRFEADTVSKVPKGVRGGGGLSSWNALQTGQWIPLIRAVSALERVVFSNPGSSDQKSTPQLVDCLFSHLQRLMLRSQSPYVIFATFKPLSIGDNSLIRHQLKLSIGSICCDAQALGEPQMTKQEKKILGGFPHVALVGEELNLLVGGEH